VVFLIFVATFVTLACVVLPLVTLVLFCVTGRAEVDVRPSARDDHGGCPAPDGTAIDGTVVSPAIGRTGAGRASRLSNGRTVVT
jgi:hypothetical protein